MFNISLMIFVFLFLCVSKLFFKIFAKDLTSHANAHHLIGIWLKFSNVQLSSKFCQYIWKHTNRMPDKDAVSRCRMTQPLDQMIMQLKSPHPNNPKGLYIATINLSPNMKWQKIRYTYKTPNI